MADNRLAPRKALTLARTLADLPTVGPRPHEARPSQQALTDVRSKERLDLEAELQDLAGATDDHLEGVLAFLEKRPPAFNGR